MLSPIPIPSAFVVKNGSKRWSRISGARPQPRTVIEAVTDDGPASAATRISRRSAGVAAIASIAFRRRFSTTCWRRTGSAFTSGSAPASAARIRTRRLRASGSANPTASSTTAFTRTGVRDGRGHLTDGDEARGGGELLLLLPGELARALALGDVEHRSHPAGVAPLRVDERRLVHERVEPVAAAAHELHLDAGARRGGVARRPQGLEDLRALLRGPVRLPGAADELLRAVADHLAEGRVNVDDPPLEIDRAHAGVERVLHRLAERVLRPERRSE